MTRIHLFILLVLAFTSFSARGQTARQSFTISGTITDTSNNPLPSATVYIPELRVGTISDSDGRYAIKDVPKGSISIQVAYTGFYSQFKRVRIDSDLVFNFALVTAITEEKEIIVTGVMHASSLKRNPIPIVRVSRDFMNQNVSTNIIETISKVGGVSAVSTGPNVAKPFVRGLGFNRVLTLFDGIRHEGQQWGDEHGIEIDGNSVDRIEIIKGPASLLYGSDALAGVINMIPAEKLFADGTQGEVGLLYQTNNNLAEATAHLRGRKNDFNWSATGTHKIAANYQNKIDGRVYNTGFAESSLFVQSGLTKNRMNTRTAISFYNNLQEIPDGSRDSATRKFVKEGEDDLPVIVSEKELRSYKISEIYQHIQHWRVYNHSNFHLGKGRLSVQAGYQKNIRKEFEGSDDPALFLDLDVGTVDVRYHFPQWKMLYVTAGANGMLQHNSSMKGYEFIVPDYKQADIGPFVFTRITRKKSEWSGGIRYDMRHLVTNELFAMEIDDRQIPVHGPDTARGEKLFSGNNLFYHGISMSAGFSHRFNPVWNLKLNIARGYRSPNIAEVSANGIHSGAKIYQLGNPKLQPELSFQQDVEISYHSEHFHMQMSLFNNQINNYIFNHKLLSDSGADSVIVPGYETFQYSSSRARLYGGEFSSDLHPHPLDWLHFENTVSVVFARNHGFKGQQIGDDEKYLPFIPPIHGNSELRANIQTWKLVKKGYVKVGIDWTLRQNRVFSLNGTESPTSGYSLFYVGAGGNIINRSGRVLAMINLMVDNLFDRTYQSHMSRLKYFEDYLNDPRGKYGIFNMGRHLSIRMSIPFGMYGNKNNT